MVKKQKSFGVSKGMRYKLMVAFSIMAIIPILACSYLIIEYSDSQDTAFIYSTLVIVISVILSLLGLALARGIVDPVVSMAAEARVIASGSFERKITVREGDEVGDLGDSINVMTQRIKSNIDELKNFGQKTRDINMEIHKKILTLSSLLQIGDALSSRSFELDTVLELAVQKVSIIFDSGYSVLYLLRPGATDAVAKASYNIIQEKLVGITVHRDGHGMLDHAMSAQTIVTIDESVGGNREVDNFRKTNDVKNVVIVPLLSGRRALGLLVVGNRSADFKFKSDDIDLVKIFAKQITLAIENDILMKKGEELAIMDELTGLYNRNYINARLDEEIKRAVFYQRPCSLIIVNVDDFERYRNAQGELVAEDLLRRVAKSIRDNVSPIEKIGRVGGDEFAIIVPERNKNEVILSAEELRGKIAAAACGKDGVSAFTVSIGVSENPIDGATREELVKKALSALQRAKSQGKNKVSV